VAVVIEHGVWGSEVAPVAKDILREYFGMNNDSLPKDQIVVDKPSLRASLCIQRAMCIKEIN